MGKEVIKEEVDVRSEKGRDAASVATYRLAVKLNTEYYNKSLTLDLFLFIIKIISNLLTYIPY